MYIVVVGGGKVGYYLAKELLDAGHELVILEKNARSRPPDRGRAGQHRAQSRRLRGQAPRWRRARTARRSSPRSPATTRTTSSCARWRSTTSTCRARSRVSTIRAMSSSSVTWASTRSSARRAWCSPRSSRTSRSTSCCTSRSSRAASSTSSRHRSATTRRQLDASRADITLPEGCSTVPAAARQQRPADSARHGLPGRRQGARGVARRDGEQSLRRELIGDGEGIADPALTR